MTFDIEELHRLIAEDVANNKKRQELLSEIRRLETEIKKKQRDLSDISDNRAAMDKPSEYILKYVQEYTESLTKEHIHDEIQRRDI